MVPIWVDNNGDRRGYTLDELVDSFPAICANHQTSGRALLFAFILADARSPQIAKVLSDRDYWEALDVEAGQYLTVFYLLVDPSLTLQNRIKDLAITLIAKALMAISGGGNLGGLKGVFVPVYLPIAHREAILGHPDIAPMLPCFLLLQVKAGRVSRSLSVSLEKQTSESAFIELRDLIRTITVALTKVNRTAPDLDVVFWLAEEALRDRSTRTTLKRLMRFVPYLGRVLKPDDDD